MLPGNGTNKLWVLDLILRLLDIRQAELQVILTLSILLFCSAHTAFNSHVKSSPGDLLFSTVLLVPLRFLVCVLLPRLLFTVAFTSHLKLAENSLRTTPDITRVAFIASASTAQETPIYCCNVFTESLHNNCSEFIVALFVTRQRAINTRASIVACVPTRLLSCCLAMLWPSTLQYFND
jgi:hypothetical protein